MSTGAQSAGAVHGMQVLVPAFCNALHTATNHWGGSVGCRCRGWERMFIPRPGSARARRTAEHDPLEAIRAIAPALERLGRIAETAFEPVPPEYGFGGTKGLIHPSVFLAEGVAAACGASKERVNYHPRNDRGDDGRVSGHAGEGVSVSCLCQRSIQRSVTHELPPTASHRRILGCPCRL